MERRIGREMFHHESLGPRKPKAHLEVSAQNPYVFIVGCQRSGTTLLRRIVNAHPEIAIPRETNWIAKWFEKQQGVTSDGYVTDELLPSLMRYEKFARMGIDEAEVSSLLRIESPLSYARFVSFVFDLYGMERGKSLVGDKTPSYVLRIPTLHALWPSARFVHLIRDGRDVALSMLAWDNPRLRARLPSWRGSPVVTAAVLWDYRVRLGIEAGRGVGPKRYYEVRYESLVARPTEECARLCDFLCLPYDDGMVRFHEGRERHEPGLSAKKAWRPITPRVRDWRSQMTADGIERFEAAAGHTLSELGYRRAFENPSRGALQEAAGVRAAFTKAVRADGKRLPREWADEPLIPA
jgi:hypothetical protein